MIVWESCSIWYLWSDLTPFPVTRFDRVSMQSLENFGCRFGECLFLAIVVGGLHSVKFTIMRYYYIFENVTGVYFWSVSKIGYNIWHGSTRLERKIHEKGGIEVMGMIDDKG